MPKSRIAPKIIEYVESLTLGQGRFAGEPFRLHPWQKRFIRGAWSVTGDAAMTMGRGGGKSTFTAGLAAATIDGPLVEPMAETVVVASSFEQGLIIFRHLLHFLDPVIQADKKRWRVMDSSNRASVEDRETGARVRVIASDPRRAHGLAPKLILADEVAQWPANTIDKMIAALETSQGKIPDSRMVWLGTRAATSEHPFELALNGGCDYVQRHAAKKSDPPFQKRTWKKANPGLDYLPDLELQIRKEVKKAKQDASAMASFRALRLNLGVPDVVEDVLLEAETWERIEVDQIDKSGDYVLGLDLGQNVAMSAAAAYWPRTGAMEVFAVFPEVPDLQTRGLQDGVDRLYVACAERGELLRFGHRVTDIEQTLTAVFQRWGAPRAIVADAYREQQLRQALKEVDFPVCPLVVRRMGFVSGQEDVRNFRTACLTGKVKPLKSLLMRSAMAGARVTHDAAGNPKLAKGGEGRRMRCRDDAVAAALLAVSHGQRVSGDSTKTVRYAVIS